MIKNNKGYFLTEVIIVITIVAIAITVLYVNSMSTYINQNNELTKFNTADGIYSAGAVKDYFKSQESSFKSEIELDGYMDVFNYFDNLNIDLKKDFFDELGINKIYFTDYNLNLFLEKSTIVPSIKKNLKKLKYDENLCEYRYIVIFNDDSYSTIGVDCYE